jgi:hypothetical protein
MHVDVTVNQRKDRLNTEFEVINKLGEGTFG